MPEVISANLGFKAICGKTVSWRHHTSIQYQHVKRYVFLFKFVCKHFHIGEAWQVETHKLDLTGTRCVTEFSFDSLDGLLALLLVSRGENDFCTLSGKLSRRYVTNSCVTASYDCYLACWKKSMKSNPCRRYKRLQAPLQTCLCGCLLTYDGGV